MNNQWINEVYDKINNKLSVVAPRVKGKLPYTTSDGIYNNKLDSNPGWWTNGFWAGMMWLMYQATNNDVYKAAAEDSEKLLDVALYDFERLHHDVGFMYHLSSGANYRINGNQNSKARTMLAASVLMSRFNLQGDFLRAWNGEANKGKSIIDSMMNLPLLYFASREYADARYEMVAKKHADKTIENHIRQDGSVVHIVENDPIHGGKVGELAGQGYSEGSSWSRGQAWALYGYALSYKYTLDSKYLDVAKQVAHYFIACVSDDYLPKCDFRSPKEPVIYDATAGAIAACGLLEIACHVLDFEKSLYETAAINLLQAMEEKFCNWSNEEESIVVMGTERYDDPEGHHMPIIYGDFFFVEAILRLKGEEFRIW